MPQQIATTVYRLADARVLFAVRITDRGPEPLYTRVSDEGVAVAYTDEREAEADLPDGYKLYEIGVSEYIEQLPPGFGLLIDPRAKSPVYIPAKDRDAVVRAAAPFPPGANVRIGHPKTEPTELLRLAIRNLANVPAARRALPPGTGLKIDGGAGPGFSVDAQALDGFRRIAPPTGTEPDLTFDPYPPHLIPMVDDAFAAARAAGARYLVAAWATAGGTSGHGERQVARAAGDRPWLRPKRRPRGRPGRRCDCHCSRSKRGPARHRAADRAGNRLGHRGIGRAERDRHCSRKSGFADVVTTPSTSRRTVPLDHPWFRGAAVFCSVPEAASLVTKNSITPTTSGPPQGTLRCRQT